MSLDKSDRDTATLFTSIAAYEPTLFLSFCDAADPVPSHQSTLVWQWSHCIRPSAEEVE
jgi:hypothetical protein